MRPRFMIIGLGLIGLGGLAMIASTGTKTKTTRRPINPVGFRIPSNGLTRSQVRTWASQMGIDEHHLILMIALNSERGGGSQHRREHIAIARTAVNRLQYPRDFAADLWGVLVGNAATTGKQGGTRQFATTRPPAVDDMPYLYEVAAQIIEDGPQARGITHFNHATGARADVLEERWGKIGYEVVEVDGVAGMFFRPEPWKHEALG